MKYNIGEEVYFKSLGSLNTYYGKIIEIKEHEILGTIYSIRSGKYVKFISEDEIIKERK